MHNATEPRTTLVSPRPISRILPRVNRKLELAYAGVVVAACATGFLSAWVVARVALAGNVAATVAATAGFIVGLGLWRRLVLRPYKRRAADELARIFERSEPLSVESHLDGLTFAATVWREREAASGRNHSTGEPLA